MRIIYYTDSLRIGGKERQLVELLKGLKRLRSVEVLLICMDRGEFYESDVNALSIPISYLCRSSRWDIKLFKPLYEIVKNFKADVIHTNSMMSTAYALPIAKLLKIPLINGSIRNCFQSKSLRWRVERALLYLSDYRIANSEAGLHSRQFTTASKKDFVIHNGFDVGRLSKISEVEHFADRHEIMVGMVAEFRPDKDFRTFLLAAQIVAKKQPSIVFTTVGDGETLDAMKELAQDLGERVLFLGRRKDVERLVSTFAIGVLTTFTEGISNSIMEYMVMGKPVIATDCSGSRELVLHGKTGFLIAEGDHMALADRVMYLLDNPEEARAMGEAGRQRIAQSFSLEGMVEKTVNVYEIAIKTPRLKRVYEGRYSRDKHSQGQTNEQPGSGRD